MHHAKEAGGLYDTPAMQAALNLYTLHKEAPDSFFEEMPGELTPEVRKLLWQLRAQGEEPDFGCKGKRS